MRMGDWTRVALVLVLAAGAAPAEESAWTLFEKGLKQFQHKEYARAEKTFDAALRLDARCQDARFYLGRMLEMKGRTDEAVQQYGKIDPKYPTYSLAAERLGHIAFAKGKLDVAAAWFKVHAEARPTTTAWLQLAAVQLDLEKYKEAEVTLDKAGKLSRGNLDIAELKARLYMETERYDKALAQYDEILDKIPVDTTSRYLKAVCLRSLEREDDCVSELEKVLETDPWHEMALRTLADCLDGDPGCADQVKECRRRLEILKKAKPHVRRVSGEQPAAPPPPK